jgi:G3E family GTPase
MDDIHKCYEILGLSPDASIEARKQAYKDLVKVWHPDRFSHDPRLQQKAEEKLQEINEAYEKIKSLKPDEVEMASWAKEHQDSSFETHKAHKPSFTEKVHATKKPKRNSLVWIWIVVFFIVFGVVLFQLDEKTEDTEQYQDAPSSLSQDSKTYFTIGSTKSDVLSLQGAPSRMIGDTWFYDASQVAFSNDRVIGYSNNSGNLHMKLLPKTDDAHIRAKGYFTIGSTKDEVIALQGTPNAVIGNIWTYDLSEVTFHNEKVVNYSNASKNLKIKTEREK